MGALMVTVGRQGEQGGLRLGVPPIGSGDSAIFPLLHQACALQAFLSIHKVEKRETCN